MTPTLCAPLGALACAALVATATPTQAAERPEMALGRAVFLQHAKPPCALCHTLAAAGASGTIGPILDELKPDAERVLKVLRSGMGAMPSFRDSLSPEQMDAVAHFVAASTGSAR